LKVLKLCVRGNLNVLPLNLNFLKGKFISGLMAKKIFPEAVARLYSRVFVCRVCKTKIRADPAKVRAGKVKCRKCGSRDLRPKKRPM
jgi:ribosomal protein L40E